MIPHVMPPTTSRTSLVVTERVAPQIMPRPQPRQGGGAEPLKVSMIAPRAKQPTGDPRSVCVSGVDFVPLPRLSQNRHGRAGVDRAAFEPVARGSASRPCMETERPRAVGSRARQVINFTPSTSLSGTPRPRAARAHCRRPRSGRGSRRRAGCCRCRPRCGAHPRSRRSRW